MTVQTVALLVAVASAIWVGFDASGRDFSNSKVARTWKGWAAGTFLLWIVFFPLYLAKRDRAPKRSGVTFGAMSTYETPSTSTSHWLPPAAASMSVPPPGATSAIEPRTGD